MYSIQLAKEECGLTFKPAIVQKYFIEYPKIMK